MRRADRVTVFTALFASACVAHHAGAAAVVLEVSKEAGAQYQSVQAAVDAAPEGATVRVGAGVYEGTVRVTRPLVLEGAGPDRTTIVAPRLSEEQLRQAVATYALPTAPAEERQRMSRAREPFRSPAVRVENVRGVELRNLRLVAEPPVVHREHEPMSPQSLLFVLGSRVRVSGCAVVGSPGNGVVVGEDADVELRDCLVGGLWGTGIVVARSDLLPETAPPAKATVVNCDVRNCYYAGIRIGPGQSAIVRGCRISGAAWHGIRYDDASPTIEGNRIFANARCGIYASGKTAGTVKGNLFLDNQIVGMSCWFASEDAVVGNTFARNAQSALSASGGAKPVVERNVFYKHPAAVLCSPVLEGVPAVGDPRLKDNLFWQNDQVVKHFHEDSAPEPAPAAGKVADPGFVDAAGGNFSLAPDALARRENVGVVDAPSAESPWPLQAEEKAIIPDGERRDHNLWKHAPAGPVAAPVVAPAAQGDGPVGPVAPAEYLDALADLHHVLGREYPCFALKEIDWDAVGRELLPRAAEAKTEEQFGLLCLELVARLQDSHAFVGPGKARPPVPALAQFDPGFACLIDDRQRPVVYYVDKGGPADRAGVRPGMALVSVNGTPAEDVLANRMKELSRYAGYSSDRFLRYHAAQFLVKETERGAKVRLEFETSDGTKQSVEAPATAETRYLPRLPVPIPGIDDAGSVTWKKLDDGVGYVYVRRIGPDLIERLDRAVAELKDALVLIIDVRGNSGGGFDSERSHRNFNPDDPNEPDRPRFAGPVAVLIDARAISAAEGWASWFVANKRAKLVGEATAGASSRKREYVLKNGLYKVQFPVKAYNGYLDRPIERRGLEPDVPVRQNAKDLSEGRDTVLKAARRMLKEQAAR